MYMDNIDCLFKSWLFGFMIIKLVYLVKPCSVKPLLIVVK